MKVKILTRWREYWYEVLTTKLEYFLRSRKVGPTKLAFICIPDRYQPVSFLPFANLKDGAILIFKKKIKFSPSLQCHNMITIKLFVASDNVTLMVFVQFLCTSVEEGISAPCSFFLHCAVLTELLVPYSLLLITLL